MINLYVYDKTTLLSSSKLLFTWEDKILELVVEI